MHRSHFTRPFVAASAFLALAVAGCSDDPVGLDDSGVSTIVGTSTIVGSTTITVRNNNEEGWSYNADANNQAVVVFSGDEARIGSGSLHAEPITNTINGNADKFILLNGSSTGILLEDLEAFSIDFLIDDAGSSLDANQFYLNLYAFTPDPNDGEWYDCRFDYVAPSGSATDWTTLELTPSTVATAIGDKIGGACPTTYDAMPTGSTVLYIVVNMGDTSGNDTGVGGYFDKAVMTVDGSTTTWDFEPVDEEAPLVLDIVADPVAVGTTGTVTATIDDSSTGGSSIASAGFTFAGGAPMAMDPLDGTFDGVVEGVEGMFTAPAEPGLYDVCVTGTDEPGNTGGPVCVSVAVYDPSGGFVSGGGWIDSPDGAVPTVPGSVTISGVSGDATVDPDASGGGFYLRHVGDPAPAGYAHSYQWATPSIVTPSPEDGPVTLTGIIDVDEQVVGQVAMIGLLDRDDLAAGNSGFQRGAYIYVYRTSATSWRIGPTDGNVGGEIVQTTVLIADTDLPADGVLNVTFTVDGTADGTTCAVGAVTAPAGCMTLQVSGGSVNATLVDSYGDRTGLASSSPEFANGAVPGWDDYVGSMVGYELTVPTAAPPSPTGKATFGFVSRYKKGASTPDGNTQFTFNAGDLNFHSSSYDWLVVNQGGENAQFKGEGTVNGMDGYRFMLWAGDHDPDSPDTFRIRVWEETGSGENVVYDNGSDQAIGGGSIIVHAPKGNRR